MEKVGLFTPIEWHPQQNDRLQTLSLLADSYLWFGGKVARVISWEGNAHNVTLETLRNTPSLWFTIAKIVSYATIILPLIALVIKVVTRCIHQFHVVDETVKSEQEGPIQIKDLSVLGLNLKEEKSYLKGGRCLQKITLEEATREILSLLNQAPEGATSLNLSTYDTFAYIARYQLPSVRPSYFDKLSGEELETQHAKDDANSWLGQILASWKSAGAIRDYTFRLQYVRINFPRKL